MVGSLFRGTCGDDGGVGFLANFGDYLVDRTALTRDFGGNERADFG